MTDIEKDIEASISVLKSGGLILYPTDTIWGIGCDATNPEAVSRIYEIKKRADQKAMIVLAADEQDILKHTASPDLAVFDYLHKAPKPTTVIYDGALGLADNLTGADGSVAIRICRDAFCRRLIKRFRKPIVSTSANVSGMPPPENFMAVSEELKQQVDYVVRHRQDDLTPASPSALIRWENGRAIILRP